jgi:hypothetical protein
MSWILIIAFGVALGLTLFAAMLIGLERSGFSPARDLARFLPTSVITPEQQRDAATRERLEATCRYWKEQVEQADTQQNRAFRDMACARADGLYR